MTGEINLIQKSAAGNKQLAYFESVIRKLAWVCLGGLFVVSILVGALYFYLNSRASTLTATKVSITRQINDQSAKEGILLSLKERVQVATRALDAAKPWGNLFTILEQLAPQWMYDSLSIDDSGKVSVVLGVPSIDDSLVIVTKAIELSDSKKLRAPHLVSLILRENGQVQITMSFIPVL